MLSYLRPTFSPTSALASNNPWSGLPSWCQPPIPFWLPLPSFGSVGLQGGPMEPGRVKAKASFAPGSCVERSSHDDAQVGHRTNLSSSMAARRGMARSKTWGHGQGSMLHSLKTSATFAVHACSSLIEGSVKKSTVRRHPNSQARAGAWIAGTADDQFRMSRRLSNRAIRKQVAARVDMRRRRPRWIIDPRHSQFMAQWDGVTALALLFTAAVTPYEVGFVASASSFEDAFRDPLFWFNRVVDCIFIFDLLLQFVLMYPTRADGKIDDTWVEDPQKIFGHYLRTWFVPDVISVAASAFDIAAISSKNKDGSRDLGSLQAVRMVRAFRLVKLVRMQHSNLHSLALQHAHFGPRLHREPLYQRNDAVAVPTAHCTHSCERVLLCPYIGTADEGISHDQAMGNAPLYQLWHLSSRALVLHRDSACALVCLPVGLAIPVPPPEAYLEGQVQLLRAHRLRRVRIVGLEHVC